MRAVIASLFIAATAAAEPDPARRDAEAGFAALQAGNLDRAEALTRKAIDAATTQEVLGAVLFNLGVIEEKRGHRPEAIQAYTSSLEHRPHRTAREHLAALDRDAAARFEPFAPRPMLGPVASIDPPCTDETGRALHRCACEPTTLLAAGRHGVAAPFLEVAVFHLCRVDGLAIAVRLADGWYVAEVGPQDGNLNHCGDPRFRIAGVAMHAGRLAVEYRGGPTACWHHDSEWSWHEHGVIVVGVGGSHAPSITPAIAIDGATLRWAKDGSFDYQGDVGSAAAYETSGLDQTENRRGRHALVFP